MTDVADAKRKYYAALGVTLGAVADMERKYYEGATAGSVPVAPLSTTTVAGVAKKGAFVAAAAVPFADLTAAANAFNALRTSLINAGLLASS